MDPNSPQFRLSQAQRTREQQLAQQGQTGLEFRNAEDLIRYDASQTPPPEQLEQRVKDAVNREAVPARPWWKRFLGLR